MVPYGNLQTRACVAMPYSEICWQCDLQLGPTCLLGYDEFQRTHRFEVWQWQSAPSNGRRFFSKANDYRFDSYTLLIQQLWGRCRRSTHIEDEHWPSHFDLLFLAAGSVADADFDESPFESALYTMSSSPFFKAMWFDDAHNLISRFNAGLPSIFLVVLVDIWINCMFASDG